MTLRDYPCEEHQKQYVDIFMLIFYLVGINTVDLCRLEKIRNGRIEYRRAKTKKIYNIKKTTKERRKNLWDFSIN